MLLGVAGCVDCYFFFQVYCLKAPIFEPQIQAKGEMMDVQATLSTLCSAVMTLMSKNHYGGLDDDSQDAVNYGNIE